MPKISIIIITRNSSAYIESCLKSLFLSQFSDFEVIVLDNASTDDTTSSIGEEYLQKSNLIFKKLQENIGSAAGRNKAAKMANGEFLFFLDPDTEVEPICLRRMYDLLHKNPELGACQAKLLNATNRTRFDSAGEYMDPLGFLVDRARGEIDVGQLDYIAPVLAGKTAALMVRRKCFVEIKGFDEHYFFLLEDGDLFWRLWLYGYPVLFCFNARVYHAFNTPQKNAHKAKHYSNFTIRYYGARNYIYTLLKNLSLKKVVLIAPFHIAAWVAMSLVLFFKGNLKSGMYILAGLVSTLISYKTWIRKRFKLQSQRVLLDNDILFLFIGLPPLKHYLNKILSYTHD